MEQAETKVTQGGALGTSTLRVPTFGERAVASPSTSDPTSGSSSVRHGEDGPASAEGKASQNLSRELDKLLERLPGLAGEDRDKAKAEFLEIAAKSAGTATELVAKSADVAKRVTGRVKSEWDTGRERAESFVHANPLRAVGIALGIGVMLGARLFGSSRQGGPL
ncbi:hypothetical protein Tamer19_22990 [Cupriavidus sp. TA19]|uniref:DUF883 family protein n=1 Tax=unclassified Cupriavidus TaxID=2640874 RepID=UPI000E2E481F|nr:MULTISPECIES: hypothetical protein [unclassified Cupriavidus]BDB28738.1 DUF883 family protein [Cupriavidus sp. P-10]GLC92891.1 hypothetical protein Tamer19_22990 [Cupriavidus sp. TA19]